MYRLRLLASILLIITLSVSVSAEDFPMQARLQWVTQSVPTAAESEPVLISKKTPLLFTRIASSNAFIVPTNMTTGVYSIPAGTIVAKTANMPIRFCEPLRRRKQNDIYCVADTNGDDTLDTLYTIPYMVTENQYNTFYEYLIGTLQMYSQGPLQSPLAVKSLIVDTTSSITEVMLDQTGKTNFALCIHRYTGSSWVDGLGNARFCGKYWNIKGSILPVTLSANGGRITLFKSSKGKFTAKIESPPSGMSFPEEK